MFDCNFPNNLFMRNCALSLLYYRYATDKLSSLRMDLGNSCTIMLFLVIIWPVLLCLLVKWHRYQLRKKEELAASQYETVCENMDLTQQNCDTGAYEQYCERKSWRRKKLRQNLLKENEFIELPLEREIIRISNDLSGLSSLRQKLDRDFSMESAISQPSLSLKQLTFPRIKTTDMKRPPRSLRIYHQFIQRLICYQQFGISLIEVRAQSLTKQGSKLTLNKQVQQTLTFANDQQFQTLLESLGLQKLGYWYSKVVWQIDISDLKDQATYSFKTLQTKQYKLDICQDQYMDLVHRLNNQ